MSLFGVQVTRVLKRGWLMALAQRIVCRCQLHSSPAPRVRLSLPPSLSPPLGLSVSLSLLSLTVVCLSLSPHLQNYGVHFCSWRVLLSVVGNPTENLRMIKGAFYTHSPPNAPLRELLWLMCGGFCGGLWTLPCVTSPPGGIFCS